MSKVVVIVTLTTVGAKTTSPDTTNDLSGPQSELSVCSVLGAWNVLWLIKLVIWGYIETWLLRSKRNM